MIKLSVFFVVQLALFTSLSWPVLAQEVSTTSTQDPPVLTYTVYLPTIQRGKPVNSMTRLTLRPEDVPEGFILSQDSVITDFSEFQPYYPIEAYQTSYINFDQLFSGVSVIASSAILFDSPASAQQYLQFVRGLTLSLPNTTTVVIPLHQDHLAVQILSGTGVANIIIVRNQSVVINIATAGIYPVASDINETLSLAQIVINRF